jgi:hypothetical protein
VPWLLPPAPPPLSPDSITLFPRAVYFWHARQPSKSGGGGLTERNSSVGNYTAGCARMHVPLPQLRGRTPEVGGKKADGVEAAARGCEEKRIDVAPAVVVVVMVVVAACAMNKGRRGREGTSMRVDGRGRGERRMGGGRGARGFGGIKEGRDPRKTDSRPIARSLAHAIIWWRGRGRGRSGGRGCRRSDAKRRDESLKEGQD